MNQKQEIDWLLGEECIQICIGLYQVILIFTDELIITIENQYFFGSNVSLVESSGSNSEDSKNLVFLLGNSITQASREADDNISINFSDGSILKLSPSEDGMESFSLIKKEMRILV